MRCKLFWCPNANCGAVSLGAQIQVEKPRWWAELYYVGQYEPCGFTSGASESAQQRSCTATEHDASISVISHPALQLCKVVDPARLFVPIFVGMAYVGVGLAPSRW